MGRFIAVMMIVPVLVGLLIFGAQDIADAAVQRAGTIRVQRLELVDSAGRVRARLSMEVPPKPISSMPGGRSVVTIVVKPAVVFRFFDEQGRTKVWLGVDKRGNPIRGRP